MTSLTPTADGVIADSSMDPGKPFSNGVMGAGFAVIALFLGGLIAWSLLAPIESAVVAPGVISVDSSRKTVQHLEGGIVAEIAVREGDSVRVGELLLRLQDTGQTSQRNQLRAQLDEALAGVARLRAEREGAAQVEFPESLNQRAADPAVAAVLDGQRSIFTSRQRLRDEQTAVLTQRIAGFGDEIDGLNGQIDAANRQLGFIGEELVMLEKMFAKKLVDKPRLLALRRDQAAIEGGISEQQAAISRANQGVLESRLRIAELQATAMKESDEQLRLLQARAYELGQQLTTAEDILQRTRVRSPIDGTVVGMQVHTIGGVVAAGEPLLDVVPSNEELVVQASVDPRDIEQVHAGLPAHVELTAFNRRVRTPIEGVVRTVSADSLVDPLTGVAYYMARIELQPESLLAQQAVLQPGMTADVMIRTGARTPLEYLLEPITRSLGRALREE